MMVRLRPNAFRLGYSRVVNFYGFLLTFVKMGGNIWNVAQYFFGLLSDMFYKIHLLKW